MEYLIRVVAVLLCLQPMMMPLLREMPEGSVGIRVMQQAVHTSLFGEFGCNTPKHSAMRMHMRSTSSGRADTVPTSLALIWQQCCRTEGLTVVLSMPLTHMLLLAGVALTVYFGMGLFGAALYGQKTGKLCM